MQKSLTSLFRYYKSIFLVYWHSVSLCCIMCVWSMIRGGVFNNNNNNNNDNNNNNNNNNNSNNK